jgi:hypothetical protein
MQLPVHTFLYISVPMFNAVIHEAGLLSGNALDLYSKGAQFESRPGYRLSWLKCFLIFPSLSRQMPR